MHQKITSAGTERLGYKDSIVIFILPLYLNLQIFFNSVSVSFTTILTSTKLSNNETDYTYKYTIIGLFVLCLVYMSMEDIRQREVTIELLPFLIGLGCIFMYQVYRGDLIKGLLSTLPIALAISLTLYLVNIVHYILNKRNCIGLADMLTLIPVGMIMCIGTGNAIRFILLMSLATLLIAPVVYLYEIAKKPVVLKTKKSKKKRKAQEEQTLTIPFMVSITVAFIINSAYMIK